MPELQVALRYVVFAAFAASVLVALASWLVRTRRISPFGALGRTLRTASDPLIRPIETRLVRAGGNPVHAGWWLVVAVAAAGVLFLSLWDWLGEAACRVAGAYSARARPATAPSPGAVYGMTGPPRPPDRGVRLARRRHQGQGRGGPGGRRGERGAGALRRRAGGGSAGDRDHRERRDRPSQDRRRRGRGGGCAGAGTAAHGGGRRPGVKDA